MPLVIPQTIPAPSIAAIWAYATRTLTDPDSYKADVSALALQTTLNAVGLSVLTRAPAGEYDTEMARITLARALLIDSLGTPANFMADVSALALQTSVDLLLARIGDPADPTVDATIKGYLLALSAMTETVGTTVMTGAELVLYETDRDSLETYQVPFLTEGYVSLGTMAGGDTIVLKEYAQAADGTYRLFANHTYTGAQTDSLIRFEQKIGGFDYKVSAQQTAGVNRTLAHLFDRRRVK